MAYPLAPRILQDLCGRFDCEAMPMHADKGIAFSIEGSRLFEFVDALRTAIGMAGLSDIAMDGDGVLRVPGGVISEATLEAIAGLHPAMAQSAAGQGASRRFL